MTKAKLIIFDLDGTLSFTDKFYKTVYSGTLTDLVAEKRGEDGLKVLEQCRRYYNGKGELALLALNIPFIEWAKKLISAPLKLINADTKLVRDIKSLKFKKIIYTGSPVDMAYRVLNKIGFDQGDFDFILGWKEPELFPVKWTASSMVFEKILTHFKCRANKSWAVGDDWETDLMPAKAIGMMTAGLSNIGGQPDLKVPTIYDFLDTLS